MMGRLQSLPQSGQVCCTKGSRDKFLMRPRGPKTLCLRPLRTSILTIRSQDCLSPLQFKWSLQCLKSETGTEGITPLPSEESDSSESYEATQEDPTVSDGDVQIAVRVVHATEAFTGCCFRCNKVRH